MVTYMKLLNSNPSVVVAAVALALALAAAASEPSFSPPMRRASSDARSSVALAFENTVVEAWAVENRCFENPKGPCNYLVCTGGPNGV